MPVREHLVANVAELDIQAQFVVEFLRYSLEHHAEKQFSVLAGSIFALSVNPSVCVEIWRKQSSMPAYESQEVCVHLSVPVFCNSHERSIAGRFSAIRKKSVLWKKLSQTISGSSSLFCISRMLIPFIWQK